MTRAGFIQKYLRGNRWKMALVAMFAVFAVFLSLLTPLLFSFFIDQIINGQPMTNAVASTLVDRIGGIDWLRNHLWVYGILIVFIYCLLSLCLYLRGYLSSKASENMAERIRNDLYTHISRLPYEYFTSIKTGDLVQRCTSDVESIRKVIGQQYQHLIRSACTVIIAGVILFQINSSMAWKAVILMPVLFVYAFSFFKRNQKAFQASDVSEGQMTSVIQEDISGIRVIKAFGRERYEIDRFDQYNQDYRIKTFDMIKLLGGYWSSSDVICMFQSLIVLVMGILAVQDGSLTIGHFSVFISYESMILWPVRQMGRILADFGKSGVSIDRLNDIFNAREEDLDSGIDCSLQGDIEFDHLSFRYGEGSQVLSDLTFHIKPGQTVAIMGPTGSGKSTLVHLIDRLYDYQEGSIKLDGIELNKIRRSSLRRQIGLVLQEPFLFSKTIFDNIQLGREGRSREDVEKAAAMAAVHDVIREFDQGYDTLVGEKGVTLSGGQKQRIAIARTLMNESCILIFDDSLSAVDAETDRKIRTALKERQGKRTTLIITQRVNSARDADCILMLENGRISQSGTHEELIHQEGLYRRIYEIQSSYAQDQESV